MTNEELLQNLNLHLKEVNEMLSLGELGLLKSDELYNTKYKIEDALKSYKPHFEKIEALKMEKNIPQWRNVPKTGVFLNTWQVKPELNDLHNLLKELVKSKGGSEQITAVAVPTLKITGNTINQAISDAKTLLEAQGATSAIDRVHTVLHGYLKQVCDENNITYSKDATLNQLMNSLKTEHSAFNTKNENVEQILKSMANVLDKLNPLRNNSSLAHSNPVLLEPDEAMLVINTVNTLLAYLDNKLVNKKS